MAAMTTTLEKPKTSTIEENSFGKEVLRLRVLFGFTQKELGEILGTNERTVVRWERSHKTILRPHFPGKTGIAALESLADLLSDIFELDVIKVWVDRPNPALNNERPRDFAKKPGGIFRMISLLDALQKIMPVDKDALETVPASAIEGVFYRLISERYQNEPLSMFGAFKEGRRYNVAQTFGALYLGFDEETCQAEILGAPILAGLPPKKGAYILWDYDVSLSSVVRLDDTTTCTAIGVTQAEITVKLDHQWASSIALPLFQRRIEGLVAPSAQESNGKCLDVFFRKRLFTVFCKGAR